MGKIFIDQFLVLEGALIAFNDLICIKTKKRKEVIKEIKMNLVIPLQDLAKSKIEKVRSGKLDLAIVLYTDKQRMKKQDVDNVAKLVLDALKKNSVTDEYYIFEDDSQIIRLLIYKREATNIKEADTYSIVLSFREHDPKKQMILIDKKTF